MSDNSHIEWTDATWNPTTGCTKVSPGCDHCYAEGIFNRFNGPGAFDTVQVIEERLRQPLRWRKPRRVFVNSMSDLFHDDVPDTYIAQVFAIMALTRRHTFQVLTKRHGRMRSLLNSDDFRLDVAEYASGVIGDEPSGRRRIEVRVGDGWHVIGQDLFAGNIWAPSWPLPNVWLGVSVEDQKWADTRIPALLATPAAVRFLSCEPLLGPVDLSAWMPPGFARWRCSGCRRFYAGHHRDECPDCGRFGYWSASHVGNGRPNGQPLGWVIVGGESGPASRPMDHEWPRTIRDQAYAAEVPFFFKQWGSHNEHGERMAKQAAGRLLDGRTWDEYPQREEALSA